MLEFHTGVREHLWGTLLPFRNYGHTPRIQWLSALAGITHIRSHAGRSHQESRMSDPNLYKADPYNGGLRRANRRGARSSTLLMLVVGMLVAFPGTPAMARGTGFGTPARPAAPRSVSSIVKTTEGQSSTKTATSASAGSLTMAATPLSPTTMGSLPSTNPTTMRPASGSPTAMASLTTIPSLMATSSLSPGGGTLARAAVTNNNGRSDFRNVRHSVASPAPSWASSGTIWPAAEPVDASVKPKH